MRTELDCRKPIWKALSEFYLDTELQDYDYDTIAKTLTASKLSLNELKEIDLFEVFPVLKYNLISVAGVWNGFDEKWLYKNCTNYYQKRNKKLLQFKNKMYHTFLKKMTIDHWKEIEKRMKELE